MQDKMDESLCNILEQLKASPEEQSLDKDFIDKAQKYFNLFSVTGFEEQNLHYIILDIFQIDRLPPSRFSKFLYNSVPNDRINELTVKEIFMYCFLWKSSSSKILTERCKTCLQYLIGLIKYKIIPKTYLEQYYILFYSFLKQKSIQPFVAQLIYYLTSYDNLTPWCVSQIEDIIAVDSNNSSILALASLFKRMKLHLGSSDVLDSRSEEASFPAINKLLSKNLIEVQKRRNITALDEEVVDLEQNQIVIKSGCYPDYKRTFPEFNSISELMEFLITGQFDSYGTAYDAILTHKYNFTFVLCQTEQETVKFNYFIQKSWTKGK